MSKSFLALLFCCFLTTSLLASDSPVKGKFGWHLHFKNNQGAPEEFKEHKLPHPSESSVDSDASLLKINLQEETSNSFAQEITFPVDAGQIKRAAFKMNFMTKLPFEKLTILLKKPSDSEFSKIQQEPVNSWFGMSDQSKIPTFSFEWENAETGEWSVRIESEQKPDMQEENSPDMLLLLENDSPYRVMSHIRSYTLKKGQPVGLEARMYDEREYFNMLRSFYGHDAKASLSDILKSRDFNPPAPLPNPVLPASADMFDFEMGITFPDGKQEKVKMHDEGSNRKGGVYTATVTADQPGNYFAEVQLKAVSPSGVELSRTTQHMFTVVSDEEDMTFSDKATGEYEPETNMLTIHMPLEAKNVDGITGRQFKAYTEVWGSKYSNAADTPVAYASGMTIAKQQPDLSDQDAIVVVSLKLHANWLARANVLHSGKFVLRNAYIQDLENSVPLASSDEIDLEISKSVRSLIQNQMGAYNGVISEEMKVGPRPPRYSKDERHLFAGKNNGHKLILSHGYCAAGTPFTTDKFSDYALFSDPNQSRTNDEFAQLLGELGEQYDSFSIVAHSQGGPASLHLLAFYWSGLDLNTEHGDNHRWIQTMGSPFQGTSMASWANLGKIFGVGCGTNENLTPDGAKLWLSGIPMEARDHVYFYYTQYKPWSWCNAGANAILSWPNDGVSEAKRAPLPGGHQVMMKKGFCHTADMKYPPQCQDDTNNEFMNKKAARV